MTTVIKTHGEQIGLKVSDSKHFRFGEDFTVQLLASHQVELDVYTDKDSSEKIMLIFDKTKKKKKNEKALKELFAFILY